MICSKELRSAVAEAYGDNPQVIKMCNEGNPFLGRYLDDCSQGGISAHTIMEARSLDELRGIAQKLIAKKRCYEMWYTEYRLQEGGKP